MSVAFGQRLRALRERENLTQAKLAKLCNLSEPTISLYESGKREPSYKTLLLIADILRTNPNYLLTGKNGGGFKPSGPAKENGTPYKNKALARRIKQERLKKGWTQKQVADMLGVEVGTFSGYERSYRTPETKTLEKLANLYQVSADYLLGRHESWPSQENLPDELELEQLIREHPNIRIFGDPLNEEVKDDVLLALKTAWEIVKKERAAKIRPRGYNRTCRG